MKSAKAIRQCLEEGYVDPEIISLRSGVDVEEVEAYLQRKGIAVRRVSQDQQQSPAQILRTEIASLQENMKVASETFRDNPSGQNASAIKTLHTAWLQLVDRLARLDDPEDNLRITDSQVFGPLVQDMLMSVGSFVHTVQADLMDMLPDRSSQLREMFERSFRLTGEQIKAAYIKAVGRLQNQFCTNADVNTLSLGPIPENILEWADEEVKAEKAKRRKKRSKPEKASAKRTRTKSKKPASKKKSVEVSGPRTGKSRASKSSGKAKNKAGSETSKAGIRAKVRAKLKSKRKADQKKGSVDQN